MYASVRNFVLVFISCFGIVGIAWCGYALEIETPNPFSLHQTQYHLVYGWRTKHFFYTSGYISDREIFFRPVITLNLELESPYSDALNMGWFTDLSVILEDVGAAMNSLPDYTQYTPEVMTGLFLKIFFPVIHKRVMVFLQPRLGVLAQVNYTLGGSVGVCALLKTGVEIYFNRWIGINLGYHVGLSPLLVVAKTPHTYLWDQYFFQNALSLGVKVTFF